MNKANATFEMRPKLLMVGSVRLLGTAHDRFVQDRLQLVVVAAVHVEMFVDHEPCQNLTLACGPNLGLLDGYDKCFVFNDRTNDLDEAQCMAFKGGTAGERQIIGVAGVADRERFSQRSKSPIEPERSKIRKRWRCW